MKRLAYFVFLAFATVLILEGALRMFIVRKGHIDYLFGKRSYFLPPFHIPDSIPEPDTTTWRIYNVYDPELGWSIGKLGAQPPYYSDHQGFRCAKSYYDSLLGLSILPPRDSVYDIVCLGNSFTHGDEVSFEGTWPYQLGKSSGLKVLNLGVGGYGIDQGILRYQKENPAAKLVILALVAGDLDRATTQIYNLTFGGLKTKPLFVFNGGEVHVTNQPAIRGQALRLEFEQPESSEFLRHERYWPTLFTLRYRDKLAAFRTLEAIPLWKMHRQSVYTSQGKDMEYCISIIRYGQHLAEQRGSKFVVLLLDNLNTFSDWDRSGNPWGILIQEFKKSRIPYWSYGDLFYIKFKSNHSSVINEGLVHYTVGANLIVSKFIHDNLTKNEFAQ